MRDASALNRLRLSERDAVRDRRGLPARVRLGGDAAARIPVLLLGQGNELAANASLGLTVYGVAVPSTGPSEVPAATPSMTAGDGYADGIAAARVIDAASDALIGTVVWCATRLTLDSVDTYHALVEHVEGSRALAPQTVAVPITGGGGTTATVYLLSGI